MKTSTARILTVPVLTLALAGLATPAAQAASSTTAGASAAASTSTSTSASTSTTVASPKASTVEDGVTRSGARRMRTTATWFPSENRVVATTRTWNSVKLTGFTGGVQVVFLDRDGHVIGATGMRTFGVDGTWVGRYSRTDVWEERVDAPWLSRATSIRVVHSHAGRVRLKEIVRYAVDTATPVVELVKRLNSAKPAS